MERDSNNISEYIAEAIKKVFEDNKVIVITIEEYQRLSSERTKAFLLLNTSLDRNLEEYCQRKVKECEELKLEIEKLKRA